MAVERLFIYGTLAPGCPNHHIVSHIEGTWTPGRVKGSLVKEGWGAAMGFLGIVLNNDSTDESYVDGMILSASTLRDNWQMLDEFEGDGYERALTNAFLDSGETVNVHVYQVKR